MSTPFFLFLPFRPFYQFLTNLLPTFTILFTSNLYNRYDFREETRSNLKKSVGILWSLRPIGIRDRWEVFSLICKWYSCLIFIRLFAGAQPLFSRLRRFHQIANRFRRVMPHSGLPGNHDGGGAIHHRIENVADLRPGGNRTILPGGTGRKRAVRFSCIFLRFFVFF